MFKIGFVSKCSVLKHEQPIIVRNKRTVPLQIVVREQIPKSTDDKIKVNLCEIIVSVWLILAYPFNLH